MARSTRISRWCRRGLALLIGLALGWYAAGQWHEARMASAAEEATEQAIAAESGTSPDVPGHIHGASEEPEAAGAEKRHPATSLVPRHEGEPAVPLWLGYVVWSMAGLFALALLLGPLVRAMGYGDPGTVATQQDREAHPHHP